MLFYMCYSTCSSGVRIIIGKKNDFFFILIGDVASVILHGSSGVRIIIGKPENPHETLPVRQAYYITLARDIRRLARP